jgi:ATP-dependent RNA helicase DDX18/HAS1
LCSILSSLFNCVCLLSHISQVASVVRTLGNALQFRTSCFTSVSDFDAEDRKLRLGSEVLVTTPGRLWELLRKNKIHFDHLQVMILDETDVLFADESFPLKSIGERCFSASATVSVGRPTQFLFTSATLPSEIMRQIEKEFGPDLLTLYGPGLHRISPSVEEVILDCSGKRDQAQSLAAVLENKREALIRTLGENPSERTIVFCNTIEQCRRVENWLSREDRHNRVREVLPYHSAVDDRTREDNLRQFSKSLLKKPVVLLCTDRAARGMDFSRAIVDHVILFDFPREPSEYIRRVGRTGRAGRRGKATVLVYGKQVSAARMVVQASLEGKKIDPSKEENNSSNNNNQEREEEDEEDERRNRKEEPRDRDWRRKEKEKERNDDQPKKKKTISKISSGTHPNDELKGKKPIPGATSMGKRRKLE